MNYKITKFSVFLFAFFLPIKISLSNFFLIIYFTLSLFRIIKNKKTAINHAVFYSSILLFIPLLIGCFYTAYFDNAIHDIVKKNTFLLIPFFLSFESKDNLQKIYILAKKGLLFGVVIALFVLILKVLHSFFIINQEKRLIDLFNFNYTRFNFTNILKIHPTYLGIYVIFSTILIINLLYNRKIKTIYFTLMLLLFTIGIIFINQRIIFFIYSLVFVFLTFIILKQQILKKAYLKFLVTVGLIISISLLSFFQVKKTYIYYRFTKELNWEFSNDINSFYIKESKGKSDPRLVRWKEIINHIKEKPFFGTGTGTEKKVLGEIFKSKGMINSYNKKYDSHNQYLSVLVEFGFIGFSFFIFHLISNLYFSIKYNSLEFFSILIIVLIVSMVENYLSRNNGITFFVFFSSLYLFKLSNLKE